MLHTEVVDKVLEKEGIIDQDAKDILAQKLLEACEEMALYLTRDKISCEALLLEDWAFLKVLSQTGSTGKKFAKQILPKLQKNHSQDVDQVFMLLILGESIWLDTAKNLWMRKKKIFQLHPREFGSQLSNHFLVKKRLSK